MATLDTVFEVTVVLSTAVMHKHRRGRTVDG
jgi:hypothetical protein